MLGFSSWQSLSRFVARRPQRKIFVSYRRSDSADVTGRLYDRLSLRFGHRRIVKDVFAIPPGHDFLEYIEDVIPTCSHLLAVIGPNWSTGTPDEPRSLHNPDDVVRMELTCALAHGVRIIPVLIGGVRMPQAKKLPRELRCIRTRQSVTLRPDPDFPHDAEQLMAWL